MAAVLVLSRDAAGADLVTTSVDAPSMELVTDFSEIDTVVFVDVVVVVIASVDR